MPTKQQHIIRRQTIEAELSTTEAEARHWQERFSRFAKDVLPLQLEQLFDQMTPSGKLMRLDSLEIEVNLNSNEGAWEEHFTSEIVRKIREAIPASYQGNAAGNSITDVQPRASGSTSVDVKLGRLDSSDTQVSEPDLAVMEQFFYFLETGRLTWQASKLVRSDLEKAVLAVLEKEEMKSVWREKFLDLLSRVYVQDRLSMQFSPKALAIVATRFFPERELDMNESLLQIRWLAGQTSSNPSILTTIFWREFFKKQELGAALVSATIQHFLKDNPQKTAVYQQAVDMGPSVFGNANKLPSTDLLSKQLTAPRKVPKGNPAKADPDLKNQFQQPISNEGTAMALSQAAQPVPDADLSEGLYLENAGLVLLHPFLSSFFEAVGIAAGGTLLKSHRAVLLLQYLATQRAASPEHLLPLNKLLCGLPLNEPVAGRIRLSKKEKAEAKNLLEAVVAHWSALKNTSTAIVQGSFLCRTGKLALKADGDWRLQVEQASWDMLLENLPWSIAIIWLPWMKQVLWVEWG